MNEYRYTVRDGDELTHYGVLGMKWGVRRSRGINRAAKSTASVRAAKKKYKEANKAFSKALNQRKAFYIGKNRKERKKRDADNVMKTAKATVAAEKAYKSAYKKAKIEAANKIYSGHSKKLNKRIANMSTGKALAQTALLGSYGAMKYNKYRTQGDGRVKAGLKSIVYGIGNNATYGAVNYLDGREKRQVSKKKKAAKQNRKKING